MNELENETSKGILEFSYLIRAGEREIIVCSVEKPFKLSGYIIQRECSEIYGIWFDNKKQKRLNAERMNMFLDKEVVINNDISFTAKNRDVYPEKVKIILMGEFVD